MLELTCRGDEAGLRGVSQLALKMGIPRSNGHEVVKSALLSSLFIFFWGGGGGGGTSIYIYIISLLRKVLADRSSRLHAVSMSYISGMPMLFVPGGPFA